MTAITFKLLYFWLPPSVAETLDVTENSLHFIGSKSLTAEERSGALPPRQSLVRAILRNDI